MFLKEPYEILSQIKSIIIVTVIVSLHKFCNSGIGAQANLFVCTFRKDGTLPIHDVVAVGILNG